MFLRSGAGSHAEESLSSTRRFPRTHAPTRTHTCTIEHTLARSSDTLSVNKRQFD